MRSKKEILEKIILGILTLILIIYISVGLTVFSLFNISEKFLNKNNISDFINNLDIINIIKNELGTEMVEFKLLENDFNEIGLDNKKINNFIESQEVKNFSNEIIINMINKITTDSNINYKITDKKINNLIKNNIKKIDSNIDENQLISTIEEKIPNLVLNINNLLDKFYNKLINSNIIEKYLNYIYKSMDILNYIYSDYIKGLIIFVISSFIILLIFIRKNISKSLKWLIISFAVPAIIFVITRTIILNFINVNNLLINNILNIVNKDLINHSIIYFTISLILIIINIVIYIINIKKNNDYYNKKKIRKKIPFTITNQT